MTPTEFEDWFGGYCKRFSGVANLILKDPSIARDWKSLTSGVSIDDATKATLAIMAMDPQPFPSEHLGRFLATVKTLNFVPSTPPSVDTRDPESFKCLDCRDRGVRWVYHPKAYKPIRDGRFEAEKHLNEIVVACACDAGHIHSRERPRPNEPGGKNRCRPMLKFRNRTMCEVTKVKTKDQVIELVEFVDHHWKPANHHSEFGAFA